MIKLVLIISLCLVPVFGSQPRSVAGDYSLSNIVISADRVELTLHISLRNADTASLRGASFSLRTNAGNQLLQAGTDLEPGGSVAVDANVILTPVEFRRWHRGVNPAVMVESPDDTGQIVHGFAVMSRKPAKGVRK